MQLPLPIQLNASQGFDNFVSADDAFLLETLKQFASGKGESLVYLWGVKASGKTHLLHAICQQASNNQLSVSYLPLAELINYPVDVLDGQQEFDMVCIDDLQCIIEKSDWQQAVFNLFNRIREKKGRLIFTAEASPKSIGFELQDLVSRLEWGLVFHLQPLDDEHKIKALQMRAHLKGLELTDEIATYVLKRFTRDMNALFEVLDKLDEASLIKQRKITIPFIREVFEI